MIGIGFTTPLGNFRRAWTRCLRLAGIPDFHFHDTRHISASDLLNAGNPEQLVCQIAGWRSGNMIRQYYHKDGLRAVKNVVFASEKPDTSTYIISRKRVVGDSKGKGLPYLAFGCCVQFANHNEIIGGGGRTKKEAEKTKTAPV